MLEIAVGKDVIGLELFLNAAFAGGYQNLETCRTVEQLRHTVAGYGAWESIQNEIQDQYSAL